MASSASSTMAASHRSTRRSTDPSAADRTITIAASSGRIPGNDEADGAAAAAVAGTLTTQGRNDAVAGHGEGGGDGGDGQEQRVHALLEQIEDCGKNLRGQHRDRLQPGLEGLRREFSASAGRVRRLAADNGALSAENLSLSERVRALEEDTSQLNNQLDRQGEATMVALEETSENRGRIHQLDDRVADLKGDVAGLQGAVGDTQNRERMNSLDIEGIKDRLSSAGL